MDTWSADFDHPEQCTIECVTIDAGQGETFDYVMYRFMVSWRRLRPLWHKQWAYQRPERRSQRLMKSLIRRRGWTQFCNHPMPRYTIQATDATMRDAPTTAATMPDSVGDTETSASDENSDNSDTDDDSDSVSWGCYKDLDLCQDISQL